MSEANDQHRVSVSCKIPVDWNEEIDAISELSGVTKSQWLANLIGEALGKTDTEAKRKAVQRLSLLIASST
jgi:hypothetical protein